MNNTAKKLIPFRDTLAVIDTTDAFVYYMSYQYQQFRHFALNPSVQTDTPASSLARTLLRPIARTASLLARALLTLTDPVCNTAWNIYNRAAQYTWHRAMPLPANTPDSP